MFNLYKRLKPVYRILIQIAFVLIIFLLPTIYAEPQNMPEILMTLWIVSFFGEATCIMMTHHINMDYMEINQSAITKIRRMKPEKKRKKAASLREDLKRLVITNSGLRLKRDEDCYYKGEADAVRDPKVIKAYLQDDAPTGIENEPKYTCPGLLYITNQRMILQSANHGFNLKYEDIRQAQYYGKCFVIYTRDYPYVFETKDKKNVMHVFNVINQYSAAIND